MGQLLTGTRATFGAALCEFLESIVILRTLLQDRMATMILNGNHMILVDLVC